MRKDNAAEKCFDVPVRSDEIESEIVEEFWVRRWFALEAEVLEGREDAAGEADCPQSVDGNARGERVL